MKAINYKTNKTQDWTVFILRRIEDGVETDTILGGFYSYVSKNENPDIFKIITGGWDEEDSNKVYAVISFFDTSWIPLYKDSVYYIMTDTGSTVANRSYKLQ